MYELFASFLATKNEIAMLFLRCLFVKFKRKSSWDVDRSSIRALLVFFPVQKHNTIVCDGKFSFEVIIVAVVLLC